MNYALIENGIVANIIWLYPANAGDFPSAVPIVPMNDYPVAIGDTWDGTFFYRNGEKVLTRAEQEEANRQDMEAALVLLGVNEEMEAES